VLLSPPYSPFRSPTTVHTQTASADIACGGSYSILCAAIKKVGLYRELNDRYQDYTAFFPTNSAFEQFLDYMNVDNVGDLPSRTLEDVILLHVHSGREINKNQLKKRCSDTLKMANGDQTRTQCSSNKNQIYQKGNGNPDNDRPQIIKFDRHACNGIVHTVDEVILPGSVEVSFEFIESLSNNPPPAEEATIALLLQSEPLVYSGEGICMPSHIVVLTDILLLLLAIHFNPIIEI